MLRGPINGLAFEIELLNDLVLVAAITEPAPIPSSHLRVRDCTSRQESQPHTHDVTSIIGQNAAPQCVDGKFESDAISVEVTNSGKVGTGEYTTGFVGTGASGSDKKVGVVGLTLFDLRRRGKVGNLGMVGVNGTKYPAIRKPMTNDDGAHDGI